MSIFTYNFQKQKQEQEDAPFKLQQLSQGINRIRFIESRVSSKTNFIDQLIFSKKYICQTAHEEQKQKLGKFDLSCCRTANSYTSSSNNSSNFGTRKPLNSLRSTISNRDQNKEKAIKLQMSKTRIATMRKQQRKQLSVIIINTQTILQQRREHELIQKLAKNRKLNKSKQQSKFKIDQWKQQKFRTTRQFKNKLQQGKNYKLESDYQMLDEYQEKVVIGERIKQMLLRKLIHKGNDHKQQNQPLNTEKCDEEKQGQNEKYGKEQQDQNGKNILFELFGNCSEVNNHRSA